jgi:D-aspartate ligase
VGWREDVLSAGRHVVAAIELRPGVAKVDFKRGPDGRLWLLEVNPRFNLWHNPGAVAGVNLPAMVHAHLTGRELRQRSFRPGTRWCDLRGDRRALATADRPLATWLRFAAGTRAHSFGSWDDPLPLLRGLVLPAVRRRIRRGAPERPRA